MADILYNKENTSAAIGELTKISGTQISDKLVSETLLESRGMACEGMKNLEVSAREVNSCIEEISLTTAVLLENLASTWEEFETNICRQWSE